MLCSFVLTSLNCVDWLLLPSVTDAMVEEVSKAAQGRFKGNPSFVYEHKVSQQEGKEQEKVVRKLLHVWSYPNTASEKVYWWGFFFLPQFSVTEEKRLAVTVHHIDEEASVVPRGAFIQSLRGLVQTNRSFGGKLTTFPVWCAYTCVSASKWLRCAGSLTHIFTLI